MDQPLSFFNWSLAKALDTQKGHFTRARIRIIYTILIFALLKSAIVLGFGAFNNQPQQAARAAVALVFYAVLTKVLLYAPRRMREITHVMLVMGILIVFSSIFFYSHTVNIIAAQFVFMMMLCSFYALGINWGIAYSIIGMLPVSVFFILKPYVDMRGLGIDQELASPAFELLVMLNFITILVAHYQFYKALRESIRQKEALNMQLQGAIADAQKLAASKSDFLSTMSHELRTPLNSVVGIAELLLNDNPDERHKDKLEILQFSSLDLLSLINNILDFNKIESDKLVLEQIPFSLSGFMHNICSGMHIKASEKQLDFVLDMDPQLERVNIISDPTRLSQLIYNLAGNAIKFTDKGGVTIKAGCVEHRANEVEVMFSIQDTGVGIHPDKHEAIFESFSQGESHITRTHGGTGLGLAIVRQILVLFSSHIQLESSPGNGARFFFSITFPTAADVAETHTPAMVDKKDFSQLRILVAEDNGVNSLIMKMQLDKLNVQAPVMVENGQLALQACAEQHFDAIFMDLHMPVMDGYEATKEIRALADPAKAHTCIIAFTASVTEQEQIQESGFDDYLYKPVNLAELTEKLERVILHKQDRQVVA